MPRTYSGRYAAGIINRVTDQILTNTATATVTSGAGGAPAGCTVVPGLDYDGFDLPGMPWPKRSSAGCARACANYPGCGYFTHTPFGECYLKHSDAGRKRVAVPMPTGTAPYTSGECTARPNL